MTIASQLSQTLANMEGAAANLKTFSLQTQDQQAKQLFQQLSQNMDHAVQQLRGRLDYIMQEESQYATEGTVRFVANNRQNEPSPLSLQQGIGPHIAVTGPMARFQPQSTQRRGKERKIERFCLPKKLLVPLFYTLCTLWLINAPSSYR